MLVTDYVKLTKKVKKVRLWKFTLNFSTFLDKFS